MPSGIDWLSVSFDVSDWDRRHGLWDRHSSYFRTGYSTGRRATTLALGEATITLAITSHGPGHRGHLQFNPSRVNYPGTVALCTVQQALEALDTAWSACTEMITPCQPLTAAMLRRVDVAVDIADVPSVPRVLSSLSAVHAPGATMRSVYLDPPSGEARTLYCGSKTGGTVRAYDLGNAHGTRTDVIRVEVQGRKWLKTVADISTVADLTEHSAEELFDDRFRWSGLGLPICAPSEYLSRLDQVRDKDGRPWSNAKKDSFLGHMVASQLGSAGSRSSSTLAEYRRVMREIGILDLGAAATNGRDLVRLSPSQGCLVQCSNATNQRCVADVLERRRGFSLPQLRLIEPAGSPQ